MKKKVLTKKLLLSKQTIASLSEGEMNFIFAGGKTEIGETCLTDAACCPDDNSADT